MTPLEKGSPVWDLPLAISRDEFDTISMKTFSFLQLLWHQPNVCVYLMSQCSALLDDIVLQSGKS